jgi:hypothetical protein
MATKLGPRASALHHQPEFLSWPTQTELCGPRHVYPHRHTVRKVLPPTSERKKLRNPLGLSQDLEHVRAKQSLLQATRQLLQSHGNKETSNGGKREEEMWGEQGVARGQAGHLRPTLTPCRSSEFKEGWGREVRV